MTLPSSRMVPVHEPSQVAEARRAAIALASQTGLSEQQIGNVGIVATELTTNLCKHGGGGELWITPLSFRTGNVLDLVATDSGSGFPNLPLAFEDGYSTAGSPGTGMGAIRRLSSRFDASTLQGAGAAVYARFAEQKGQNTTGNLGVICLPLKTESVCGDGWYFREGTYQELLMVADGLGHGPGAAEAAEESVRGLKAQPADAAPAAILNDLHHRLRSTRGAAISICCIDKERRLLRFAGVGNVSGSIVSSSEKRRSLASNNGTIGHSISKIQEFSYPFSPGDLLVMHSDGLTANWVLPKWPGLSLRAPGLIAAILCRLNRRERDDATIAVLPLGAAE